MGNNTASVENGKKSRFTSDRQPKNRGRKKSIFGVLAKKNNLSLDDVRKVYKNILTAKSFDELDKIKVKFPSILTEQTIDMLKQDKLGHLISSKQIVIMDEEGNVKKVKGEREKSYDTIMYMLDRIFGTPTKVDVNLTGDMTVTDISPEERKEKIAEILKKVNEP